MPFKLGTKKIQKKQTWVCRKNIDQLTDHGTDVNCLRLLFSDQLINLHTAICKLKQMAQSY